MEDIFDGYGARDLDDIRTAVDAVHRAMDAGARDEHAGAGTMRDAVERIHAHLVESIGEQRAIRAVAALVYGLTVNPSTTPDSWKASSADRMVDLLKRDGTIEQS